MKKNGNGKSLEYYQQTLYRSCKECGGKLIVHAYQHKKNRFRGPNVSAHCQKSGCQMANVEVRIFNI